MKKINFSLLVVFLLSISAPAIGGEVIVKNATKERLHLYVREIGPGGWWNVIWEGFIESNRSERIQTKRDDDAIAKIEVEATKRDGNVILKRCKIREEYNRKRTYLYINEGCLGKP